MKRLITLLLVVVAFQLSAQSYFYSHYEPFDSNIPSPEEFLGYSIGSQHTRHDRIVAYLDKLAELSNRAAIMRYGKTNEHRELVMLTITTPENLKNLYQLREQHLTLVDPGASTQDLSSKPVFINLAYGVHGNEASSSEAAMLTAYTLVASNNQTVLDYINNAVVFIDPTLNPDGRDRFTQWANQYRGAPLVDDPLDAEHNEAWPRGRTNHYWFDLNRDWWLAINPESRGKLKWFHEWYPNVVTDFHEMGSRSTYFFEPMKPIASKDPIMPKENYTTLNETFGKYYAKRLDEIGSLYYTKESFDGTYPGYGSSYPDLQGGLALLFEQGSSRGHVQKIATGKITFPFTIRNQYTSSLATIEASVENKKMLFDYQKAFFKSAITNARNSKVSGYIFGDNYDENRTRAFIDKLLLHRVKVYEITSSTTRNGYTYQPGKAYYVPTAQPQYRMVQSAFETYDQYRDSVYYDASAWSLVNFYNMKYAQVTGSISRGKEVTAETNVKKVEAVQKSEYGYLISWDDYNVSAFTYCLQKNGVILKTAFKPFSINASDELRSFSYGSLFIHAVQQKISADSLYQLLSKGSKKYGVEVYSVKSGMSTTGIDLGSNNIRPTEIPKALMFIGDGVSSYEAGEVWHLLDTRVGMPITKLNLNMFSRINLDNYNVLVMVSGRYSQLDSAGIQKIKQWIGKGNTLITSRGASEWAVNKKLVKEAFIKKEKKDKKEEPKPAERKPYVEARENSGKKRVGGAIFKVDLDLTHPLAFGYHDKNIPVYRNSNVWLAPSKSAYSTVAKYTDNPHIDGFITDENLNKFLKPSASLIVSSVGGGRVIMFADNPNFRGSWYGTNRLFLNAIFLGQHIYVPR
ncbi:MAG: M14 family zinc carboxypeptidase [Bacteroidota bacterium]